MSNKTDFFNINWLGNILQNLFVNYTYHIQFGIVHPKKVNNLDLENDGIVIAETGVTSRYQVESLVATNLVGWNTSIRSGFAFQGTLELYEPLGLTFYETLYNNAEDLGIESPLRAGFIIGVSFLGSDYEGSYINNVPVYNYPVLISNINSVPTEGGTRHTIEFVSIFNSSYDSWNDTLQQQITIQNVKTFGEFIEKLNLQIEKLNILKKDKDVIYPDNYTVTITKSNDQDLSSVDFTNFKFAVDEGKNYNDMINLNKSQEGYDFTIPKGSTITDTISMAYLSTDEAQKHVTIKDTDGQKNDSTTNAEIIECYPLPVFFKIDTDIEFGPWDSKRNDYQRKIVYKIIPTFETNIIYDMVSNTSITENKSIQEARVKQYAKYNLMRKRYNYWYTGSNTDILNFNFNLNNAWFSLQPVQRGSVNGTGFDLNKRAIENDYKIDKENEELNPLSKGNIVKNATKLDNKSGTKLLTGNRIGSESNNRVKSFTYAEQSYFNNKTNKVTDVPIRFKIAETNKETNLFPSGKNLASNVLMGSVFSNLLGESSLVSINIDIIGDPYWLGVNNTLLKNKSKQFKEQIEPDYVDFKKGSNAFFLEIQLPKETLYTGDQSGVSKKTTNVIEGIYIVTSVTNSFQDGQFTQTLTAIRDNYVSSDIIEDIKITDTR